VPYINIWEGIVNDCLCRVRESENGRLDVVVFEPGKTREPIPMAVGTTIDEAKAVAVRKAAQSLVGSSVGASSARITAPVKWFNAAKGYGFLEGQNGNDIFVHFSSILMEGYRFLDQGESVELEVAKTPRGGQAHRLIRLSDPDYPSIRELLAERYDRVAVAILDRSLRVIGVTADGRCHFVDDRDRLHGVLHLRSNRSTAYATAVEELESLINMVGVREQALHDFFVRYPDFILTDDYLRAHSKLVLEADDTDTLIPDFMLEPVSQIRLCDLLELKLPSVRLDAGGDRRQRFAATVLEACAQLRNYRDYFEEKRNRERFRAKYGLDAFRPRMLVVIGRRGKMDPLEWRRLEGDLPELHVQTYDDLLDRAKRKLLSHGTMREDGSWILERGLFVPRSN
jgi:cold shock CspA family protein